MSKDKETTSSSGLQKNAISGWQAAVIAIAFAAPAVSMFFNTSVAASFAGPALPLIFVLSTIAIAFLANSLAEFSRKVPSSGYAYSFVLHTFGPKAAFLASWTNVICFQLATAVAPPVFGYWSSSLLHQLFGWNIPWSVIALFLIVVIWVATVVGIKQSIRIDLVFLVIEIAAILGFAIYIIFHGGNSGNNFSTFLPSSAKSTSGIMFAMVYGILSFQGFESATTLGEEAREPHKTIPRALYTAIILTGIFYVIVSYAATIGYGPHNMDAYGNDSSPFLTLAQRFGGPAMATMIGVIAIVGLLSNGIAALNAGSRIYFSLARESMLPKSWATLHPVRQTPYIALTVNVIVAGLAGIGFGYLWGPMTVWGVFGGTIGVSAILLYITINISLGFFYKKKYPSEFKIHRHVIWPAISVVLFILPLYSSIWPIPPYPFNLVPYILIGWILIGCVYLWYMSAKRPELIVKAGQSMSE